MHKLRLWAVVLFLATLCVPGAVYVRGVWRQHRDKDRAESLQEVSFQVRSISSAPDDFHDLEPLVDLVGDRRFVLLTEATHDSGATFGARRRLISFLHQRLDFDVLVIESSFLEMDRINQSLSDSNKYRTVVSSYTGLHPARTQRALFDYVHETRLDGRHPIQVMGLHPYYTERDDVPGRCKHFFAAAKLTPLVSSEWADFEAILRIKYESGTGTAEA